MKFLFSLFYICVFHSLVFGQPDMWMTLAPVSDIPAINVKEAQPSETFPKVGFYSHRDAKSQTERKVISATSEDQSVTIMAVQEPGQACPDGFLKQMMLGMMSLDDFSVLEITTYLKKNLDNFFIGQTMPHFVMARAVEDQWNVLSFGDFDIVGLDEDFKTHFRAHNIYLFPVEGYEDRVLAFSMKRCPKERLVMMTENLSFDLKYTKDTGIFKKILNSQDGLKNQLFSLVGKVSKLNVEQRVHGYIGFENLAKKKKILRASRPVVKPLLSDKAFSYFDHRGSVVDYGGGFKDNNLVLTPKQVEYLNSPQKGVPLRKFYHELMGTSNDYAQLLELLLAMHKQDKLHIRYGYRVLRPESKKLKTIKKFIHYYPNLAVMIMEGPKEAASTTAPPSQKTPVKQIVSEGIPQTPFKISLDSNIGSLPTLRRKSKSKSRIKDVTLVFEIDANKFVNVNVAKGVNVKSFLRDLGVINVKLEGPERESMLLMSSTEDLTNVRDKAISVDNADLMNVSQIFVISPKATPSQSSYQWAQKQVSA